MKKSIHVLALLFCSLLLILSACSSSDSSSGPNASASSATKQKEVDVSSPKENNEPVEIEFWYALGGANGEVIQEMVEEFNASQNEVKVNATYQGDYYENHAKVMAAVAAGNAPDVTQIEIGSIAAFADAGALEDLTPYAEGENGLELNDFIEGLMGSSYWQGRFYALPFARSTPLLYLNVDMLKEHGLDPAGPKTWDELRQFAQTMSKEGEVWGFETPIDIWFYEALVFQNGGEILSEDGTEVRFNSPEGIEPLKFWKAMMEEGSMKMPPGEKYNAWDVAASDFTNGKVGMIFTTTGALNSLMEAAPFEVGTAFMPMKKSYGAPTGGSNLVIMAQSSPEKKEAAWKFLKWMTDTEQTIKWSKRTGYMPVRVSAVESDEMAQLYEEKPQFKVAVDQLEYAKTRPMAPGYSELQEVIMAEIQRAILDQATPEEALNAASQKAEQILK